MLKTLAKRKAHKEGLNPTEPSGSPEMSQSFGYSHASASGSQLSMATADSSTSDVSSSHNTIRPHALSDTSPAQSRVTLASTNSSTSNESWLSRVILPRNALSIASRVTSQATFMTIGSSVSNEPQTSHFVGMRDAISVVGAPGSSLESGRVYALPSGGGSEGSDITITPNQLSNTIISKSRFTLPYFKGLIRLAKKPKISTPIDPVHLKHIGFNGSIGDFRGVPKQWERLFKESEISRSNRAQQPQAMMEIINFSKDTVADPYGNDDADSFVGHADTAAYLALSLTPMHISSPNLLHQLSHSSQQLPPDLEKSTFRPGTSQPPSRVAETTTPSTFTSDSDGITEKNEGSVADDETEIHGAEADLDVEDEDEDELILAGGTGIPIGP
ncbi:signal transducing kinase of the PAK, partial [Tulasnella sp. 331]